MAIPAAQDSRLGFTPGDHVCAFFSGSRNVLDDIVVDYITEGLGTGNNGAAILQELKTRRRVHVNGVLPDNLHYQPEQLPG